MIYVNFYAFNKMTPEAFAEASKKILGEKLVSAVLYGSSAAGDRLEKVSDYNVLFVVDPLGVGEMEALAQVVSRWTRDGNPAPLLFTSSELRRSCDVFPIEMLDMIQSHRILSGNDALAGIEISQKNLRHQVEFELRGKILGLRTGCLKAGSSNNALTGLLLRMHSPTMSVLRATLRLYQNEIPAGKMETLAGLAKYIKFDQKPFEIVHAARSGREKILRAEARALFAGYIKELETITSAVDTLQR
jgi:hypothetical protein